MCCFSQVSNRSVWSLFAGAKLRVFDTKIFARVEGDQQWLAYSMELASSGDVAMILPLPVIPGVQTIDFINLEHYPELFDHLENAFGRLEEFARSQGVRSAAAPLLEVHSVGAFEASFVPSPKEFSRLDPRFRISDSLWKKIPEYSDYGFAVFKLARARRQRIHPMAFRFPTRAPDKRFFPTVHIHDNRVHETAKFQHALYFSGPEPSAGPGSLRSQGSDGDERSKEPAQASVAVSRAEGLVLGEQHLQRRLVSGRQPQPRHMDLIQRIRARRDRVSELLGAQASGRIGLSYALRTTGAAVTSILLCQLLAVRTPIWTIVSAVVVILPGHRASVASAALRVIANLVGAGVGAAISAIGLSPIPSVVLGLLLVAALCRLLAIDAAARSASVGLIIVSLQPRAYVVGWSEMRIQQVLLGCAIAFAITLIAAQIERWLTPGPNRTIR